MKKLVILAFTGLLSLGLAGCDTMNNQNIGQLTGGAIGGLVGSQFGAGGGRYAAIAGGTLLGAIIGGNMGRYMDNQDRMRVSGALENGRTGHTTRWRNPDTGNSYEVTPEKTYYRRHHSRRQACREYRTTAFIGGKREQVYGKACRTSDGAWKIVK